MRAGLCNCLLMRLRKDLLCMLLYGNGENASLLMDPHLLLVGRGGIVSFTIQH